MNKADRIAYSVKCQTELLKVACAVVLGIDEYGEIMSNTGPCNPPDYSFPPATFCELPLIVTNDQSLIAIAVRVPLV